jgi:hypothetical protein
MYSRVMALCAIRSFTCDEKTSFKEKSVPRVYQRIDSDTDKELEEEMTAKSVLNITTPYEVRL